MLQKISTFAAVLFKKGPVAVNTATSKRFHKFWFLVLENPGFGWDFLVICFIFAAQTKTNPMMKRILTLVVLLVILTLGSFAQSKKELANQVQALNERCTNLESQISNYQSLLMTLQSTQLSQAAEIKTLRDSLALLRKGIGKAMPDTKTFEEKLAECDYSEDEKKVLTFINDFWKAKTWEEKCAYVMPMEKKEQIMESLFKGSGKTEINPYWAQFFCDDFHTVGKVVTCLCDNYNIYYVVITEEGYKIDVEGRWARRLEKANLDFNAKSNITTPLEIRGEVSTEKIHSETREGKDYYYFYFAYSNSGDSKLYVLKNSPVAKRMLEDSKRWMGDNSRYTSKRYILNVAYDPGLGKFVVKKIVKSGTWSMYDKDK